MKKVTRFLTLILSLIMMLSLVACGSAANSTVTTADTTSAQSVTVSYPVTVTDHLGRSVTIEKQPEKLVSGYYITTSLMIALGLDDKLVGVEAKANTRNIYSLCAPSIVSLPNVGTAKAFDLEGCAALNPDLVVIPTKLKDSIPAIENLGITVIAVNPEDQNLLFETIDMIDTATNTISKGDAIKNTITSSLEQLTANVSKETKPSVYLAGNSDILTTAGSKMYQNSMIENAGGKNCAADITDTYWSNVSYEQILAWNPDYIFLAADSTYTIDSVLSDDSLKECNAVKNKNVYQIPGKIEALDSPVPGSFLASEYMALVMHEKQVTADDYKKLVTNFYETYYGFTPDVNE